MPTTIDVSDLSPEQIEELQRTVAAMRSQQSSDQTKVSPDQWVKEFNDWIARQRPVHTTVDCSRDTIYAGRGE